jgi:YVTN family beta-propeller protein
VRTINVGGEPRTPVAIGNVLLVVNSEDDTISVIDPIALEVTHTVKVGRSPQTPVLHNNALYVSNYGDGTVSVVDAVTYVVLGTLNVGKCPQMPLVLNGRLYVSNYCSGSISVISTEVGRIPKVSSTKKVGSNPRPPIANNGLLYLVLAGSAVSNGEVIVLDPADLEKKWLRFSLGHGASKPVILDGVLYATNLFDNTLSMVILDAEQPEQQVRGLEEPRSPLPPVVHGKSIYIGSADANAKTIRVFRFRRKETVLGQPHMTSQQMLSLPPPPANLDPNLIFTLVQRQIQDTTLRLESSDLGSH